MIQNMAKWRSLTYVIMLMAPLLLSTHPESAYGFSMNGLGVIAKKYGDDFAKKLDDFARTGGKISDDMLIKIGSNVDDFKQYIGSLDQTRKADILTEIAQKENLVNDFDSLAVKSRIARGEISDDAVLLALKNDESFRKFISNDEYFGRWDIDDVPFRKNRMTGGQDTAKSAAQSDVERMKAKNKWEAANNKKCTGQVHHIIPVEMIKAKNQKVDKLFDNCGEFFYEDSGDYFHGPRNTVCILNGHGNHPNYNREIEKHLQALPLNMSRSDTCKAIAEVRNCFRKNIEAQEMGVKINNMSTDILTISKSTVTCGIN